MGEQLVETTSTLISNTKHDVHMFAVVRVKVAGIKAANQVEAIKVAGAMIDFHALFESCALPSVECVEFAEEFSHYLVDEVDDLEYNETRWYKDGADDIVMADNSGR